VSFVRRKTGVPVLVHLGTEALTLFTDLPAEGLFLDHVVGGLALPASRCPAICVLPSPSGEGVPFGLVHHLGLAR